MGDRNGRPQINEITIIPGMVEHSGEIVFAMTFPKPLTCIIPRIVDVKAMNGNTFLITISMDSRPAAKNLFTT